MGKNKLARFADVSSFTNCVETTKIEAMQKGLALKGKWNQDFFRHPAAINLELACGGGEYTVGLAQIHPKQNFIGVDIKGNRLWKGAKFALENQLNNVGFLRTRIDFIENCFGSNEVKDIWITFPDPQPQKNRKRKRLTHPVFLQKYQQFTTPNTWIRLKTDSDFLYQFTLQMIKDFNLKVKVNLSDVYAQLPELTDDILKEELELKTYYEQKWLAENKKIKYISFAIHGVDFTDAKAYHGFALEDM